MLGLGLDHGLTDTPRTIAASGFLGAYTTFATFSYKTVRLLEDSATGPRPVNVAAQTVLGASTATSDARSDNGVIGC